MSSNGQTPLADPTVRAWDAVVRGDAIIPSECDADEFALLRQLHQSDRVPLPSDHFLDDLEDYLRGLAPARSSASWLVEADAMRLPTPTVSRGTTRPMPSFIRAPHWRLAWIGIAAVLVLALAGLLAVYAARPSPSEPPAIPAAAIPKPEMEPLLQFDFVPPQWGMPDATTWTELEFCMVSLDPGKSFDTNWGWYLTTDGPFLLSLLDGELAVTPNGPSLVYRASASDQSPVANDAGHEIVLEPGDGIVYSVQDIAAGRNPGTKPARALYLTVGRDVPNVLDGMVYPTEFSRDLQNYDLGMPPAPTSGAQVSIQQLVLQPYDTYTFEDVEQSRSIALAPNTQLLYWYSGAFDSVPLGDERVRVTSATLFRSMGEGDYTMVNLGSEPVTLYIFVLEPAGSPEDGVGA